ncbi:hypothetical protein [Rhodonellum sp.]|nr:hypothetical protein [Rhodonellum sp.]MDO9553853.1 hypothetical protein [Rhodonellum sp.]
MESLFELSTLFEKAGECWGFFWELKFGKNEYWAVETAGKSDQLK